MTSRLVLLGMLPLLAVALSCAPASKADLSDARLSQTNGRIADRIPSGDRSEMPDDHGVAVVELFTSEGCSSCPPADRLLSRLTSKAQTEGVGLYALSFHVDYWNQLGWRDPFSRSEYSDRQRMYARVLGLDGIYTPQMVVNGTREFVGSNESTARASIAQALERRHRVVVELACDRFEKDGVDVSYTVHNPPPGALLNLALVEGDLEVDVARGENGGRVLHHDNVVRVFRTIQLDSAHQGEASLRGAELVNIDRSSVIGYVQLRETMEVLGANAAGPDANP